MRGIAPVPSVVGALASVVLCALPARALAADALASNTSTGTIEFRVLTTADDVRFYIDGNRVPARKRAAAWHAARTSIAVPAGEHKVEAKFRVPGAGDDAPWIPITTPTPVLVEPGALVRLDADVRGARMTDTVSDAHSFHVQVTHRGGTSVAVSSPSTGDVPVDSKASPPAAENAAAANGTSALVGGSVAAAAVDPKSPANDITIHGDEVISDGRTVKSGTTGTEDPVLIGPGLVDDTPAVSDLPKDQSSSPAALAVGAAAGAAAATLAASDAPTVPEPATTAPARFEISFLVESEPAAATVILDGKSVGVTPLRIAIDPRQDHLLVVERAGCSNIVQLLATEGWVKGRAAQTTVKLDCK